MGPSHLGHINGVTLNTVLEFGLEAEVVVLVGDDIIIVTALHVDQAYGVGIIM